MSKKINPCPFCGNKNLEIIEIKSEDDPSWTIAKAVRCKDCLAVGRHHNPIGWTESDSAAIESWNLRGQVNSASAIKPLDVKKEFSRILNTIKNLRKISKTQGNIEFQDFKEEIKKIG